MYTTPSFDIFICPKTKIRINDISTTGKFICNHCCEHDPVRRLHYEIIKVKEERYSFFEKLFKGKKNKLISIETGEEIKQ